MGLEPTRYADLYLAVLQDQKMCLCEPVDPRYRPVTVAIPSGGVDRQRSIMPLPSKVVVAMATSAEPARRERVPGGAAAGKPAADVLGRRGRR